MAGTLDIATAISAQDMHLLPRNMREIAETVGIPAFATLVLEYGGGFELCVPGEATPDHRLWELIGPDAFRALVQRFKGDRIEIAKCDRAARELQRRAIRHDYFVAGLFQDAIAKKYGLTVRHIRNILNYIREADEDRNGRLF